MAEMVALETKFWIAVVAIGVLWMLLGAAVSIIGMLLMRMLSAVREDIASLAGSIERLFGFDREKESRLSRLEALIGGHLSAHTSSPIPPPQPPYVSNTTQ